MASSLKRFLLSKECSFLFTEYTYVLYNLPIESFSRHAYCLQWLRTQVQKPQPLTESMERASQSSRHHWAIVSTEQDNTDTGLGAVPGTQPILCTINRISGGCFTHFFIVASFYDMSALMHLTSVLSHKNKLFLVFLQNKCNSEYSCTHTLYMCARRPWGKSYRRQR